MSVLSLDQLL
nr:unnamed protein product [Callosobruchus chinensis]